MRARIGGITLQDCGFFNGPHLFPRLSSGEAAELSISPGIRIEHATRIAEFSYRLTLSYNAKLFLFRKSFKKSWIIELRNFPDGFSWNVAPASST